MIQYIGESEDGKEFVTYSTQSHYNSNLLHSVINFIIDRYVCTPVFLGEVKDLHASDGAKVNGLYRKLKHQDNGEIIYIITLESEAGEFKKAAAFIDEFAHHLSQQDHKGNLFELYYDDLKRRLMSLC